MIGEDDCYIVQSYFGYALRAHTNEEVTIICVLIRKGSFFREILELMVLEYSNKKDDTQQILKSQ